MVWLFGPLNTVGTIALVIYNLLQYKEKKKILGGASRSAMAFFASRKQRGINRLLAAAGIWIVLETIIVSAMQHYAAGYFNGVFGNLFHTGANYFGMMAAGPLLVLLACLLLRIDPLAQMDLITPGYPLALIFTKIACYVTGCCRGFAWEYGIYNPSTKMTEFPAQLLEAAVALALFIFLISCKRKMKKGTVFPIYLIVYSATRFFTEFTRCEPRIFMRLKMYQFLCIGGVIIGLLEYLLVCVYNARVQKTAGVTNGLEKE